MLTTQPRLRRGWLTAPQTPVVARGGLARFPGLRTTSTRRTLPKPDSGASALVPLLDGSTAGELIPELEVAAVLGAERHERSEGRLGYRNGYRPRTLATQAGDIDLLIP